MEEIAYQRLQFEQQLHEAEKVDDVLPVYVHTLPYYSRILAAALSYSLKQSMQKGGIYGLSFKKAKLAFLNLDTVNIDDNL